MISACVANVEHRLNQIRQICVWHACEQKLTSQREYQSNRLCTFANPAKGLFSFSVCDRNLQMFWIHFTVDTGFFRRYFQPPSMWISAALESRELLAVCLKKLKGISKEVWKHDSLTTQYRIIRLQFFFRSVLRCVSKA